jgi:proteasome alpha subunit
VSMPFYVSPEQVMKDKADFARKAITRIRSGVVLACDAGILFVAPNPSRALRKFSELYDRIAFAAVGRYNEFESLRKAGVRYADMTGFQYDRRDVTARGLADWYAQLLGSLFTDSNKPYEVEIVVAEVAQSAEADQIYRIIFDGSVAEEHAGYVVMGGQADKVAEVLKARYQPGLSLTEAMRLAIAALAVQNENGGEEAITGDQLEAALLERNRPHRAFRRLAGARLDALIAEARPPKAAAGPAAAGDSGPAAGATTAGSEPGATTAGSEPGGATAGGEEGSADGGSGDTDDGSATDSS